MKIKQNENLTRKLIFLIVIKIIKIRKSLVENTINRLKPTERLS